MRADRLIATIGVVILASTSPSLAILAEDYVAIRFLEPPAVHPPPDCEDFIGDVPNQTCGAGPAFPAGISNAGDVAGHVETNFPHLHHNDEGIRWLRRTGYTGDNVRRYALAPGEVDPDNGQPIGERAKGVHGRYVTSGGLLVGDSNVSNATKYAYDIVNNQWYDFGKGSGIGANNNGKVLGRSENCCGGHANGYYPRVSDINLVSEPFTVAERGELWRLPASSFPSAINDDDLIVGRFDPTCLPTPTPVCFGQQLPMRIEPVGENEWGEPIALDELADLNESSVSGVSNTDPAFGAGDSRADDGQRHGVIWNVHTGQIVADFGPLSNASRINSAGTIAIGTQQAFTLPPTQEPMLWWTENDWASFGTLNLHEVLGGLDKEGLWNEITSLRGINDRGQIVGMATLRGEFGELLDPTVTDWSADLATGIVCGDGPCGIPFLLDTLALGTVLAGDVDNDGLVNNLDITPFIVALSVVGDEAAFAAQVPGGNFAAADIDGSGDVNNLDITPFIAILAAGPAATAVPEPASAVLLVGITVLAALLGFRKGKGPPEGRTQAPK